MSFALRSPPPQINTHLSRTTFVIFPFVPGDGNEYPNILQEANMPVISNEECSAIHGTDRVHPFHVCVEAQGKSACSVSLKRHSKPCSRSKLPFYCFNRSLLSPSKQGDPGGPLVCQVSGVWTLVGETSWGDVVAREQPPVCTPGSLTTGTGFKKRPECSF